ncbi:hypothetical protein K1T35_48500 (plasmid) [Pseudonocardia sp. DSM 110487]|uniref:hypothetical protein n=1 Tax=Pseudonocardia sp. DSM 110487 TaxID=2865833 RepID=UPI001C6A1C50|nr:hypothetical protein [Pseudonocardia sp. DSM 110487]QYN41189.1 hypothetical protein K1T35_48500 [Pseudonocardia sp. DSM 110487]
MASVAGEIFDAHGGDAMAIAELVERERHANGRLRARVAEMEGRAQELLVRWDGHPDGTVARAVRHILGE